MVQYRDLANTVISSSKSPTRCTNFPVLLSWRLFTAQHVSGVFSAHHQELNDCSGSLWFYLGIVVTVVLYSWSGRPARPSWWWVGKRPKHVELQTKVRIINWKLLHQVGDLFELNVKLWCQKVKLFLSRVCKFASSTYGYILTSHITEQSFYSSKHYLWHIFYSISVFHSLGTLSFAV